MVKKVQQWFFLIALFIGIGSSLDVMAEEASPTSASSEVQSTEVSSHSSLTPEASTDSADQASTNESVTQQTPAINESEPTAATADQPTSQVDQPASTKAVSEAKDYGSQYFTAVNLTDIAGNALAKVDDSDKVKVNYNFSIPGNIHAGETMTLQLPEQLKLVNYSAFPLMDATGLTIANVTTDKTSGLMTVTFTEAVEGKTDINGSVFFWAKFEKSKVVDGANTLAMPVNGATTDVTLTVRKDAGTPSGLKNPTVIFKSGSFDKNNPAIINWTLTINNAHQKLVQPQILDTIGAEQTLVTDSFKVNYRDANKKSLQKYHLVANQDLENTWTKVTPSETGFTLYLDNLGSASTIKKYSSAVINYQTKVDPATTRFVNGAGTKDEAGQPQNRNATVNRYGSGGSASGTVQEALDQLTDTIDEAESLDETELTAEEANQLTSQTETAKEIVANEEATVQELDEANANLETVIQEVQPSTEPPVDNEDVKEALTELETIVEEANTKNPADYTPESWQPVAEAKEEADKIIEKSKENIQNVTKQEVVSAKDKLVASLDNLVPVTPQPEPLKEALEKLKQLVAEIEQKTASLYTEASWQKVSVLFDEAKRLIESGQTSISEINELMKQLNEAVNQLQLNEVVTQKELPSQLDHLRNDYQKMSVPSKRELLPRTGEKSGMFVTFLGVFFILGIGFVVWYRK